MAIVLVHNVWEISWVLIITLFGWGNIVKAIIPLWFPNWTVTMTKKLPMDPMLVRIGGVVFILLALVLYAFGYGL